MKHAHRQSLNARIRRIDNLRTQRGMTVIELVTASSILLTLSLGVATFIPAGFNANQKNRKQMVSGQLFNQVVEEINSMEYEQLNSGGDPTGEPAMSPGQSTAVVLDTTGNQVSLDRSTSVPTVGGQTVTIGTGDAAVSYPRYTRINNVDYRLDIKVVKGNYNSLMAAAPFAPHPLEDLGSFLMPEAVAAQSGSVSIQVSPPTRTGYKNTTAFTFDVNCSNCPPQNRRVYNWNFGMGEGAGSADSSASHTFSQAGLGKKVFLTVSDRNNPNVAISAEVLVDVKDSLLNMTLSNTAPQTGENVSMSASCPSSSEADCGSNPIYYWTFGDGSTATGQTVTHSYAEAGQFTPSVTVSGGTNPTASQPLTVTPQGGKQAVILTSPASVGLAGENGTVFTFTTKSAGYATSGATAMLYQLDFGDGSAPVELTDDTPADESFPTTSHVYAVGGTYTARLTASPQGLAADSSDNVSSQTSATMSAKSLLDLNASQTVVQVGQPVNFEALAQGVGANPQYDWSFGDGGAASDFSGVAQHSFTTPGVYTVAVSAAGGTNPSASKQITVQPAGSTSVSSQQSEMKKIFVYVSAWKDAAVTQTDVLTTGVYLKGHNR